MQSLIQMSDGDNAHFAIFLARIDRSDRRAEIKVRHPIKRKNTPGNVFSYLFGS
jgi:hypothetical protein